MSSDACWGCGKWSGCTCHRDDSYGGTSGSGRPYSEYCYGCDTPLNSYDKQRTRCPYCGSAANYPNSSSDNGRY